MFETTVRNSDDTRERIVHAAMRLLAEHGIRGATMRMITREAGSNLAAVNYYFKSKDGLLLEVFDKLAEEINRRRLDSLQRCRDASDDGRLSIESIVRAIIEPYVHDNAIYGRLLSLLLLQQRVTQSKPLRRVIDRQFDRMAREFVNALADALPGLPLVDAFWRYHLAICTIITVISDSNPGNRLSVFSGGLADPSRREELVEQLVGFLVRALESSASAPGQPSKTTVGAKKAPSKNAPLKGTRRNP